MPQYAEISLAIASLVAGAATGLWLWRRRWAGKQARLIGTSMQEIDINVNGGYAPNVVVVRQGIPVRLNFIRSEDAPCSEWVIFSPSQIRRRLPAFKSTPVVFTPDEEGEFMFTCQFGMYRGKLIVRRNEAARGAVNIESVPGGEAQ